MNAQYEDINKILFYFEQLSAIPRPSGKEYKVCRWLKNFAKDYGFEYVELPVGRLDAPNVVVKVPASEGFDDYPIFCLQSHMDMVCQKNPQSLHNFEEDSLELMYEGDWLSARDTTLGADNGIGVAMAMAAAVELQHGQLELLFTTDEEGGLGGASALPQGVLEAKYLLNLDSEDDGFTVGCAGGQRYTISRLCDSAPSALKAGFYRLKVSGLIGGHSGVDIDKGRLNAAKVCGRFLAAANERFGLLIAGIHGGSKTTSIMRDIDAVFCSEAAFQQLDEMAAEVCKQLSASNPADSALKIEIENADRSVCCSAVDSAAIITLLENLYCGVVGYCKDFEHIVETSTSIGIIDFQASEGEFILDGAERSSQTAGLTDISIKNSTIAESLGFAYGSEGRYCPWQPKLSSNLLDICRNVYQKQRHRQPKIEIVHAGLECGVIGEKYPEMEMVSFGPLIENAHSPQERVSLSSTAATYQLLKGILAY